MNRRTFMGGVLLPLAGCLGVKPARAASLTPEMFLPNLGEHFKWTRVVGSEWAWRRRRCLRVVGHAVGNPPPPRPPAIRPDRVDWCRNVTPRLKNCGRLGKWRVRPVLYSTRTGPDGRYYIEWDAVVSEVFDDDSLDFIQSNDVFLQ